MSLTQAFSHLHYFRLGLDLFLWSLLAAIAAVIPARKPGAAPNRALSVLREVALMLNSRRELPDILRTALDDAAALLKMEAGSLRLSARPSGFAAAAVYRGFRQETIAALEQDAQSAFLPSPSEETLVIKDLSGSAGKDPLAAGLKRQGFRLFVLCPVLVGERTVGRIVFASSKPRPLPAHHKEFIRALAGTLALASENAALRDEAGKLAEDLITLQEVNKIISQSFNLEDIIRRIVVEGKRLVKTGQCHLFLLDDRRQRLVGSASTQTDGVDISKVELDLAVSSAAVRTLIEKRVIILTGFSQDDPQAAALLETMEWKAAIFAPLLYKDESIGVLIFSDQAGEHRFTQEEIFRAETLAHQASIALENARLFHVVSRSQKEWETTFDAMQDCVSVHDTNGKVIRANLALARRLKTAPPKVVAKYCSEIYSPPGARLGPCRHLKALETEGLIVEEVELPEIGGTYQISVTPWYDKNNRLAGSIHVAKDISNEKLLRQQLIQSEKLSAIGQLISGIAHELNNPLTGVMGYSQLLQLRRDLDERAKDNLLKINNLALRCQKIVQNLLSFARKQKPERTLCDINEILEKTVELRSYELQVNNIEIVQELDRHMPRTIVDAHQLQQVFLNLVTNAEQAMLEAHARGRLTIRTKADMQNGRLVIEIVDDGPGIPEAYLTRIFDPFFTTKDVGKGTGLGLSLSYGIIKEHGGNIYARSRVGEGSTFVMEIPIISRVQEEVGLAPELLPQAIHFENLVRGKRVLVVDDEKYILDFFVEVFRMFPMEVETANDGMLAMEKMRKNEYDIVVTDFKMPQMSGKELYHWVQEQRPHMLKRIIFVTGDTASSETRSFFEQVGNRYLAKPFKIEEIKEVIQDTLQRAAGEAAAAPAIIPSSAMDPRFT